MTFTELPQITNQTGQTSRYDVNCVKIYLGKTGLDNWTSWENKLALKPIILVNLVWVVRFSLLVALDKKGTTLSRYQE